MKICGIKAKTPPTPAIIPLTTSDRNAGIAPRLAKVWSAVVETGPDIN